MLSLFSSADIVSSNSAFENGFNNKGIHRSSISRNSSGAPLPVMMITGITASNVDIDSRVRARDDPKQVVMLANQLWHSDSSFKQPAAKYLLLLACVLTGEGGETEFADMRAAYDALPEDLAVEIDGLVAEHSAFHSRMQLYDSQYTEEDLALFPTVQWPIVREHPGSKRKTLFIGVHAARVIGLRPVQIL